MDLPRPREIKHPLHRQHPLFLHVDSPYQSGSCICDLCRQTVEESIYHCSRCRFDLDVGCALPPCVMEPGGDAHRFIHLIRSVSFTCDACGTDGDHSPYLCTLCQVMVHKQCISLPRTVRITEHSHRISHSYFIQENELSFRPVCGICQFDVKREHGAYYCSNCDYAAHVNCAKQHLVTVAQDEDDEPNPNPLTDGASDDESQPGGEAKNQQFSHEHDLTIIVGNMEDNKLCDGCMLPLEAPIYGCTQCDIFLHKRCSELAMTIRHPLHKHSLTLLPKAHSVDGVFKCSACDQYCHGFSYNCHKCDDFHLDIRCSTLISSILEHQGHEHPLRLALEERNHGCYCSACYHGKLNYFCCSDCGFTLDFGCANLPKTITNQYYDKHPLTLTFSFVTNKSYPDYCEICEKQRDPSAEIYKYAPWCYHCSDCDNTIHPVCHFGRYPYIKFGGAYLYKFHPHPLALVQKEEHYPPCDNCAEPFYVSESIDDDTSNDLALQCTQCNFVIHRKGPCFNQLGSAVIV